MSVNITFEASTLIASEDTRIIEGILVPYDQQGNTNLGKFSVPRGAFDIPADPTLMAANIEHEREAAFGSGVRISDTPEGVLFAARAANTPEGDQALADVKSGKRTHWSVEAAGILIEKGKAVAGRIFAAALVEKPAFPGAVLLASLAEDEDGNTEATTTTDDADATEATTTDDASEATETVETHLDEYEDEDGNTVTRKTTTTTRKEGNTTTITTVTEVVEPETADPDEPTEEQESIVSTLTASARRGATRPASTPRARTLDRPAAPDLTTLYAAISEARTTPTAEAMDTLMAALTEIKTSGALGPAAGDGSNKGLPDNWMGALWNGREYDRRFINLNTHGTDITARGKRGYRAKRGTKANPLARYDGEWAGDLTAINSANAHIEESASLLHKWALAEEIAREFFDLPGGLEFIEAFFGLIVEDYAIWSDELALRIMLTAAGAPVEITAPLQNGDYGTMMSGAYPPAMAALIQGIRTVHRRQATTTYAVVNSVAYDQLLYTPKDLVPEYVSFEVSTEQHGTADSGKVIVVEAAAEDADGTLRNLFVGKDGDPVVDPDQPAVLVGSARAIELDELGSTPLTVDALEIAKGGVDRAAHGYLQEHVVRKESLLLLGTAAV